MLLGFYISSGSLLQLYLNSTFPTYMQIKVFHMIKTDSSDENYIQLFTHHYHLHSHIKKKMIPSTGHHPQLMIIGEGWNIDSLVQ